VSTIVRRSINKKLDQLSLEWADRIIYIRRPASDFQSREQSDFFPYML